MIAPHIDRLAKQKPEPAADENILLVHVDENEIVFTAQAPYELPETQCVSRARYFSFLLAKGMYDHILRKTVLPFFKAHDVHALGVLRELFYPMVKETQYRILPIDDLSYYKKPHSAVPILISFSRLKQERE